MANQEAQAVTAVQTCPLCVTKLCQNYETMYMSKEWRSVPKYAQNM